MPPTRPLKVFLCHAHADKSAVRNLYRHLKERKIDAWLDAEKLLPGQNWQVEIPKALLSSDVIIICLSKNSVDKEGYVQKEIKFALDKALEMPEGRIFLIPARLEECDLPHSLSAYHFVNLFEEDGYKRLLRSLRVRAEQIGATKVGQITNLPREEPPEAASRIVDPTYESENAKREAAEKYARERSEQEAAEKLAREKMELEAKEKLTREKAEREKAEKIAREKKTREAAASPAAEPKKPAGKIFPAALGSFGLLLIAGIFVVVAIIVANNLPTSAQPTPTQISVSTETPIIETSTPQPTKTSIPTPTLGIGSTMTGEDGATLVYVPEGEFTMGSDRSDEKPEHQVDLSAFWVDQTEVTNKQYAACVSGAGCAPPSNTSSSTRSSYYGNTEFDEFPVIYVDWNQANAYCSWAGRELPTEAQWEKAASWNDLTQEKYVYPWGNDFNGSLVNFCDVNCTFNWADKNSNDGFEDTAPVGNYSNGASPYGAYDMAGNVREWVSDWYDETYYQSSPSSNPLGPNSGQYRVLRGGSWFLSIDLVRSAYRDRGAPSYADNVVGFRCSRSP